MRHILFALVLLSSFATSAIAHADTFHYEFNAATSGGFFTYNSPTLITTATTFVPLTCFDFGESCTTVMIDPELHVIHLNLIPALPNNYPYSEYGGASAEFYTLGFHSIPEFASMEITQFSNEPDVPSAVAPEPASFVLIGTGLLSAAGMLRRRYLTA
jgi:hypothetical protein